jgi:hypothetical protein
LKGFFGPIVQQNEERALPRLGNVELDTVRLDAAM